MVLMWYFCFVKRSKHKSFEFLFWTRSLIYCSIWWSPQAASMFCASNSSLEWLEECHKAGRQIKFVSSPARTSHTRLALCSSYMPTVDASPRLCLTCNCASHHFYRNVRGAYHYAFVACSLSLSPIPSPCRYGVGRAGVLLLVESSKNAVSF